MPGKRIFFDVDEVGQGQGRGGRHRASRTLPGNRQTLPWFVQFLVGGEGDIQWMGDVGGTQDDGLDVVPCHRLQWSEKGPLVGMRLQSIVHEDACPALARHLLQRQGNQVAEPTFWQGVLVRKQPIIGTQRQLSRAGTGVTDQSRSQPAGIAGRDTTGEEDPGMGPIAGA